MSDDLQLNVDTLEPEDEEEERAISEEEEYSCGQRVPMRKPATLVQYWINTGNPPYKALLDENELSETGSSLSEKGTLPLVSEVTNMVNPTDNKQKHKNDSSCSSVDTAVYILSNANVTKKADTIAIREGAKYVEIKSLKDISIKGIGAQSNDKIECMETIRIDPAIHNEDGMVNVDILGTKLYPTSKTGYMASEICDGVVSNTIISANVKQSNIYSQSLSCEEMENKIDESNTSQRNLDVQTIDDIASIFRQFDKTSKRLVGNDKSNDVSDRDKMLEIDTFHERQVSENSACEIIAKDTNLTAIHRKKLYTGRDSPIDLILTETHSANRLSGASLHPALDPDGTIKEKTFLVHKNKNKHSLSVKRSLNSKKVKRKKEREAFCISSEIIEYTNDDKIQDSNIDSFCKSSDFHDNSDRQRDNIPFRECDDTNVSVENDKCKQNLAFLNLNPIVLLERIKPSFKRHKLKFDKNTIAQKKNVLNDRHLNELKKLHSCEIENMEVETIDSDESTILMCQCNVNASQRASSSSNCSLDLRLNIEDDFSVSNAERKNSKKSSLKDTNMNQNKELRIVEGSRLLTKGYANAAMESQVLNKNNAIWQNVSSNKSKTYSHLYGENKIDNIKLREIKVVLERLPLPANHCTSTMIKMQTLSKDDVIWQKKTSNKSKMYFSNPYEANKKDNGKLQEIRVVLERLPANACLKEISNVTNTNIFPNKKISQNASLQTNHKRKSQIRKSSNILACKNGAVVRPVCNNYLLRMNTKKENSDEIDDIFDVVVRNGTQVLDKTEPDSTFQQKTFRHKNCSEVSQDSCRSKYSVLTITSDEDDFVRSIQHPRKRSKVSVDDNIFDEPNITETNPCDQVKLVISDKSKDCSNRNLSTVICSEKTMQKDIGLIKEKKERNEVGNKSFNSTQMINDSLRIHKNKRFVFFSSEDDDSATDNLDEHRILDSKKNKINNNNKRRSNRTKSGIDRKDVHVMFFQTKTFDTNSSDSEENNSCASSTSKALKSSSIRDRLRHHNSKEIFNDSITKRYNKRHLSSLNSSLEKHNQIHDMRKRSRAIDKETKPNEQLGNQESNGDIKSRISSMKKDTSFFSSINDIQNTCETQHKKMFSNTFLKEVDFDRGLPKRNKEMSDKSKDSLVIPQSETYVTATEIKKLLTFQTKSYYDSSDSSETL